MLTVQTIAAFLEEFAPSRLAEDWDNVGLLVGRGDAPVRRAMTCLTITPATAAEAIRGRADLVVAHHPLPFVALKRLTAETTAGRLLLDLIAAKIAVYSPHTAFDSAAAGINQRLATGLGLRGVVPLAPHAEGQGAGRWGWLEEPLTLGKLAGRVQDFLADRAPANRGRAGAAGPHRGRRLWGRGRTFGRRRCAAGCDCMVLGETRFHTCLEAEACGLGLILPGHFASERFGVECLAEVLSRQFPPLEIWASREERDPLRWLGP